jgi:hypothetical protein
MWRETADSSDLAARIPPHRISDEEQNETMLR